jgi:hypothetical protein
MKARGNKFRVGDLPWSGEGMNLSLILPWWTPYWFAILLMLSSSLLDLSYTQILVSSSEGVTVRKWIPLRSATPKTPSAGSFSDALPVTVR